MATFNLQTTKREPLNFCVSVDQEQTAKNVQFYLGSMQANEIFFFKNMFDVVDTAFLFQ